MDKDHLVKRFLFLTCFSKLINSSDVGFLYLLLSLNSFSLGLLMSFLN